jgi:hypothetical protein
MDTATQALSDRVAEIERQLGIRTEMCAGYCYQPTTDAGGMCQACRERERNEDARLRRKENPLPPHMASIVWPEPDEKAIKEKEGG